jgi:hypothetical protein
MEREQAKEFCNKWLPAWTGNKPELLISFYSEHSSWFRGERKATGISQKINKYLSQLEI